MVVEGKNPQSESPEALLGSPPPRSPRRSAPWGPRSRCRCRSGACLGAVKRQRKMWVWKKLSYFAWVCAFLCFWKLLPFLLAARHCCAPFLSAWARGLFRLCRYWWFFLLAQDAQLGCLKKKKKHASVMHDGRGPSFYLGVATSASSPAGGLKAAAAKSNVPWGRFATGRGIHICSTMGELNGTTQHTRLRTAPETQRARNKALGPCNGSPQTHRVFKDHLCVTSDPPLGHGGQKGTRTLVV